MPRDCVIADIQYLKKMDIKVLSPLPDMINTTSKEISYALYSLIDKLIEEQEKILSKYGDGSKLEIL